MPPIHVHAVVKRQRSITAETALRIGRALGAKPDYWLNLQRMYELDVALSVTDVCEDEPLFEQVA